MPGTLNLFYEVEEMLKALALKIAIKVVMVTLKGLAKKTSNQIDDQIIEEVDVLLSKTKGLL